MNQARTRSLSLYMELFNPGEIPQIRSKMADKKNIYMGFAEGPKIQQNISFKVDQLDELKKYATQAGNVNLTVVTHFNRDEKVTKSFISVYNPHEGKTEGFTPRSSAGDLPF
jgi:hypothetical protein